MTIRLVHLFTGDDGESHFTDGVIDFAHADDLGHHDDGAGRSDPVAARAVMFEETPPRSESTWHTAPRRQYVVTLSGTLAFETRLGEEFTIAPGDVLLAEDTVGGGHRWRLVDDQPWRRVYVVVGDEPA
jgi:quercetin dioxygenase-like cupin family protein